MVARATAQVEADERTGGKTLVVKLNPLDVVVIVALLLAWAEALHAGPPGAEDLVVAAFARAENAIGVALHGVGQVARVISGAIVVGILRVGESRRPQRACEHHSDGAQDDGARQMTSPSERLFPCTSP